MEYYRKDEKEKMISVHFPSVTELLEYKNNFPANKSKFEYNIKTRHNDRDKWLGPNARNAEDVIKNALIGNQELYQHHLVPKIDELRKYVQGSDIEQKLVKSKRKPRFNGYGDELDIHKVYQGQLDKAWRRTERIEVEQTTRLVTLFIQINGNSIESATASLWRAAATVLLVEELQNAGKSVKVVVGGYSENCTYGGHRMTVSAVVKQYNERLTEDRLAAMSHLGFYRTFGFAAKMCQPEEIRGGYGFSRDMSPDNMPLQFREDIQKGHAKFVIIDRARNKSGAIQTLLRAYKQMEEFAK